MCRDGRLNRRVCSQLGSIPCTSGYKYSKTPRLPFQAGEQTHRSSTRTFTMLFALDSLIDEASKRSFLTTMGCLLSLKVMYWRKKSKGEACSDFDGSKDHSKSLTLCDRRSANDNLGLKRGPKIACNFQDFNITHTAKPQTVQNLFDVFVQNDVRERPSTTFAFVRLVFILIAKQLYDKARRVQMSSTAAEQRVWKTTKRVLLYPSECHIRCTLRSDFHKSCLDDFHDKIRKRGFILSLDRPLVAGRQTPVKCMSMCVCPMSTLILSSAKSRSLVVITISTAIAVSFASCRGCQDTTHERTAGYLGHQSENPAGVKRVATRKTAGMGRKSLCFLCLRVVDVQVVLG